MMAPDLASSISFKHVPSLDDTNASASAEQYRAHVLTAYPEARIKAEFVCYTSDREGWAFDLEQSTSRKVKIAMRLAFIPVGNDQLEFKLTTGPEKFSRHQFAFNTFLTRFRTESVRSGRTAAPVADPRKAFFDQSLFEFAYHGSTNCSH